MPALWNPTAAHGIAAEAISQDADMLRYLAGRLAPINPRIALPATRTRIENELVADPGFRPVVENEAPENPATPGTTFGTDEDDLRLVARALAREPRLINLVPQVQAPVVAPATTTPFVAPAAGATPAPGTPPPGTPPATAPTAATLSAPGTVTMGVAAPADPVVQTGPERLAQRWGVGLALALVAVLVGFGTYHFAGGSRRPVILPPPPPAASSPGNCAALKGLAANTVGGRPAVSPAELAAAGCL